MMPEALDVARCEVCGWAHVAVEIHPLEKPFMCRMMVFTHFFVCPETRERVYVGMPFVDAKEQGLLA